MRTSSAGRSGPAGLARSLLLALALCACGSGGDQSGGETARTTDAQAMSATTTAADTCTGPPPTFTQTVLNGSWQGLLTALADSGISFPDVSGNDDTATVKLCRNCDSVRVEIRSGNQTPCLRASDLQGGLNRITGMFIVLDTFPAQRQWNALYPGDTVFTFVNAKAGPATLVYNNNGTTKSAPSNAWMFWFCEDGAQNPKTPQAQWRPRGTPPPATAGDVGEGSTGGTYGWMACVSGCCQFYTPPPNESSQQTTPDVANPNAPDTVGFGANQKKPYWCRT